MEAGNVVEEDIEEEKDEEIEEDNVEEIEKEEDFFVELFYQAFERRRPVGIASDENIRRSIQKIVDYFRENGSPAGVCARNRFLSVEDYLGYFYYYSPISAGVTRFKALDAIQNCENFRVCFRRPSLKLVSVGGGTGSDLVGLWSGLYENSDIRNMELLLIEKNKKWKPYFQVVEQLLRNRNINFGNASKFIKSRKITTSFICTDMRNEMIPECVEALEEANVVWMKGFLSTLRNDDERRCVTKRIISSMTRGALLVVMESLAYDQFNVFVEKRKLTRLYNTNNGYILWLKSLTKYRIISSTKVEMIIFQKT
ncbi:unnamed protein product [Larinioides sclopetarius]|uniref:Uncharacterized protein n=1 Tax=Larinioides sclopetarius TaxID=280406 RepID=A0AAV1YU26_9ARAC